MSAEFQRHFGGYTLTDAPLNRVEVSSDHRLVRSRIVIKRRARYYNNKKKKQRNKTIIPLYYENKANEYVKEELSNRKIESMTVKQMYDNIEEVIKEAGVKYGNNKGRENTDDKISEHTKNLIAKREELRRVGMKNTEQRLELNMLHRLVRREIRQDIRRYEELRAIEIINESGSTRKVNRELTKGYKIINKLKNEVGILKTGKKEVMEIATDYYRKLYDTQENEEGNRLAREKVMKNDNEPIFPEIMQNEIESNLKEAKVGKAPGPDGIENNTLKQLSMALIPVLAKLFNKITESEEIPHSWKLSEIIILHKNGSREILIITGPLV